MGQKILKGSFWMVAIGLALITIGCSSGDSTKLLKEVSGVWSRSQGAGTVEINLVGDAKTLVVDGKSYSATIQNVEMGSYAVDLKVQNGNNQPEKWIVQQIWDDMGVNYKLVFSHDGHRETLPKKAST